MAAEPTPIPGMPDAPPPYQPFTYPRHEAYVTADRLARYLTVAGMEHAKHHLDEIAGDREFDLTDTDQTRAQLEALHSIAVTQTFAVTDLLRELQQHVPPRIADQIAKNVWGAWEDGGVIHELFYEWAVEYGIPLDEKTGEVLLGESDAA